METRTLALPAYLAGSPADYANLGIAADKIAQFEDGLRTHGGVGTYEWWYFDAHLDDGAKLVVFFATKASGEPSAPLTPKVAVNLDLPDGRSIEKIFLTDASNFQASTEKCDVRIGNNRFVGDLHSYRMEVNIDNVSLELDLVGVAPSWRPKTGHWYFGEQRNLFAWLPAIPSGQLKARYVIDGVAHETTGHCYHDHNWGDTPMSMLLHNWYWARGTVGPYHVVVSYITAEEQYGYQPLPILMIAKDGVTVVDGDGSKLRFSKSDIHTDEVTGKPVANLTRYEYTDGDDTYVMTFQRQKTILQNKLADVLPPEKKAAALATGYDGCYIRFTGDFTFQHTRRGVTVLEATEPAIWELMYFGRTRQEDL